MYIKRLSIENIKSFHGRHTLHFRSGVNFLVGNNNGGKSTILQSLLFLFEGPSATRWTPETFYALNATGPTIAEVDITGGILELVTQDKFNILKKYVFEDADEEPILRLMRSSEKRSVIQNGKEKLLDVKSVCFWNPEAQQFENPTGIDARVKALFDFEAVWADSHPDDYLDFASTKTLGRLIQAIFDKYSASAKWRELISAHNSVFQNESEDSFTSATQDLANEIKALVDEQYGDADYRFDFSFPDPTLFMKQGKLHVNDGTGETPIQSKGTGMQRAIALGLIQLYARSAPSAASKQNTPLVLMLDEPETWLHPTAQLRLAVALNKIAEREQIFIITHSPYFIRRFNTQKHQLIVLKSPKHSPRIAPSHSFGIIRDGLPSWAEINYRAFDICDVEFHNEIYGEIQHRLSEQRGSEIRLHDLDNYLEAEGIPKNMTWHRSSSSSHLSTLPTYIRNKIHHPENILNPDYTSEELEASTVDLLSILSRLS